MKSTREFTGFPLACPSNSAILGRVSRLFYVLLLGGFLGCGRREGMVRNGVQPTRDEIWSAIQPPSTALSDGAGVHQYFGRG